MIEEVARAWPSSGKPAVTSEDTAVAGKLRVAE